VGWEGDASHRSRKWPVLTVEYANRGTLDDYFDYHTSPSFSPKNAICCDVRNGLQALHDCNVVHEDLKFPNVLVFSSNDERPMIAKLSGFSGALLDTRAMTSLSFASRPWNMECARMGYRESSQSVNKIRYVHLRLADLASHD